MAMNPMQRKANNSFLLGILVTLLVTGLIIAFLIYQISNLNAQIEEEESLKVYAYVVADTISSGETIDETKLVYMETNLGGIADANNLVTTLNYETVTDTTTGIEELICTQKAKVDLSPGTILTADLLYEGDPITSDLRTQEYSVIVLPSQLQTGEYIDIRLRTPDGRDLIVISYKEVTIPQVEGIDSSSLIWLNLTEDEILTMSCAIVESYEMEGAMLYATTYVEPGIQEAATATYIPNDETMVLINSDPNIVQEAKNELLERYGNDTGLVRQGIENATNNDSAESNVISKTEDEISALQDAREDYIDSLT